MDTATQLLRYMLYIFLETNNLISVIHFPFVWDDHFPFLQKLIVFVCFFLFIYLFFLTKGRKEPVVGIFLWAIFLGDCE